MADNTFSKKYEKELQGQVEFLQKYLPRIDSSLDITDVQRDYSDGVVRGNLVEFKTMIENLNTVLSQAIKYLSSMRIKGRPIPANIILISLNNTKAYVYRSDEYLEHIEKVYIGAASRNNEKFVAGEATEKLDYSNPAEEERMIGILRTEKYTKIHIDENCIVGWALSFYKQYPTATKAEFIGDETGEVRIIGEIRKPEKFREYIYPYTGRSNKKFRYLMDRLNDVLHKKNLGAFYTHPLYAEKSLELVRKAIERVPEGNDYVIIDRCAGTGNLESSMTEEELSHTIVSTYEYYEYKVLMEAFGDKVRHTIPPTERIDTFNGGMVRGANALSREYITNETIKQYIDNPKCTIILFENPPFADTTSIEHQKKNAGKKSTEWKQYYASKEMREEVKGPALNDLGNVFIWSAFKYYLRQPTDSYIVYSPVKYWKAQHLIHKKFLGGFAFNRKHFHTNIAAAIMVALWSNEEDTKLDSFKISAYDINAKDELVFVRNLPIKKIHSSYSQKYFDKRTFADDIDGGVLCSKDGTERIESKTIRVKPITNENIVGYMAVYSSGFDNPDNMASLLVAGRYDGNGFYLRNDNYLEKLPMFAASRYVTYNREWTERSRIMKSGDSEASYRDDIKKGLLKEYLLKCLLFTVLEPQNHMREFVGTDGRHYKNQLCLDTTNGETLADKSLKLLKKSDKERLMLELWDKILKQAKETSNYNPAYNYGLYQIKTELNTTHLDPETGDSVADYPELNGNIETLACLVKDYYLSDIVPNLFKYEFLK
ncbi:hypothetical protein SAMN02910409_0484 [Prevotellaceae bacterium HUN156]|nr:hypothetical protein SAMN02910409_0484 [Prevotellaceae bacterium HUN156]